nr:zinc finger BED domain-containing protein DAYSLEEPER [Tanacetum cinerariifolium]
MTSTSLSLGSKIGRHEPGSRSSSEVAGDLLKSSQSATVEDDDEDSSSGAGGVSFKSSFERTRTNGRAVTVTVNRRNIPVRIMISRRVCIFRCPVVKAAASYGQTTMGNDRSLWQYETDQVRDRMAKFVIQETLPFDHFNNRRMTDLIKETLQPRYCH